MLTKCPAIFHSHFHYKRQGISVVRGVWVYGHSLRMHRSITVYTFAHSLGVNFKNTVQTDINPMSAL